jgi:hypothetical protein
MKYIIAKKNNGKIEFFAGITRSENPTAVWTPDESKARRYADQDAVLRHLCLIPGGMWKQVEQ